MAESDDQDSSHGSDATDAVDTSMIDELLQDPQRKEIVLKKLGFGDDSSKVETSAPASKSSGNGSVGSRCQDHHFTPSGKSAGGWTMPPFCGWRARPRLLALWRFVPQARKKRARASKQPCAAEPEEQESDSDDESDTVHLIDEAEALELIEFDPSVAPKEAPKPIVSFLEKHFNKTLSADEREAIMKDFPKPKFSTLTG